MAMRMPFLCLAMVLGSVLLTLVGCTSDPAVEDKPPPVAQCSNSPVIVRTTFDPKEGRAPLDVAFTVVAEDLDLDVCDDELLLYHWDFDCDGFEDVKPTKSGRVTRRFATPGDYKVCIWVTDKDKHASKKIVKFVKAAPNRPPVITRFFLDSYVGESPFFANVHWEATDPDGLTDLQRYELDWGDGSPLITDTANLSAHQAAHTYTGVGTFKITLRIFDQTGAMAERSSEVAINTKVLPTNFLQTIGASRAMWIDDHEGAHFAGDFGLYDWMLVADGAIGLKVLRYPLDAFSVTAPSMRPAELIGMSDPGGKFGTSRDVVAYKTLAVAAGEGGLRVWNYRREGDAPTCAGPWDTNCYPGTPTSPTTYCSGPNETGFFFTEEFTRVALVQPAATSEVWAIAAALSGGAAGGLYGVRIDLAANPAYNWHVAQDAAPYSYTPGTGRLDLEISSVQWQALQASRFQAYETATGKTAPIKRIAATGSGAQLVYWAELEPGLAGFSSGTVRIYPLNKLANDCWLSSPANASFETYLQPNVFQHDTKDMVVDGDFVYVAFEIGGFGVYDAGTALRTDGILTPVWKVNSYEPWRSLQTGASALALAPSRAITDAVDPAAFLHVRDLDPADPLATFDRGDCNEAQQVLGGVTYDAGATVSTQRGFYPGNRVAFGLKDGLADDNFGLGYRVLSFNDGDTEIEGPLQTTAATWASVYPFGVSTYAILPAYPGRNPVVFAGPQAAQVARNGRCLNFVNAYGDITQPVEVSFEAVPLLFVNVVSNYPPYVGIYAYDRSNPYNLIQINDFGLPLYNYSPNNMTWHDETLYISSSAVIASLDVSDPHHLAEARDDYGDPVSVGNDRWHLVSTYLSMAGMTPPAEIGELIYRTTPTNPQGVLLATAGPVGIRALYLGDFLNNQPGTYPFATISGGSERVYYLDQPSYDLVPDLQLGHEGEIKDIALVDNRYALVAQKRGGVLVFDISSLPYAGDPTFVSHVRTASDPKALRYVSDATNSVLFIADDTSLYKIDDFDPLNIARNGGSLVRPAYGSGYTCVDASLGKTFACSGSSVFFGGGVTLPVSAMTQIRFSGSANNHTCVFQESPPVSMAGLLRLGSDWLGNRLFLFADVGFTQILEVLTDGAGNVRLFPSGGDSVAQGCFWTGIGATTGAGYTKKSHYQNRAGLWKRLYSANNAGNLYIWNIDTYEQHLADPAFNLATDPDLMGQLDLSRFNGGYTVNIQRMASLGPYLFLGTGSTGAWILDVGNAVQPQLIGRSAYKVPGLVVGALNAVVYPNDPQDPAAGYTYLVMVSDNSVSGGGILFMRYPNLAPP